VTYEEALDELGLSEPFDPDTARRAYLKLLKTRKPETDPEGFRRLRDAYELVRGLVHLVDGAPRAPQRAAPEEHDAEEGSPPPIDVPDAVVDPYAGQSVLGSVAVGDRERACEIALARLKLALAHPDVDVPVEPHATLRLIIELQADGDARRARSLTRKLARLLERGEAESRVFTFASAVHWTIAKELAELPEDFPPAVQQGFARALIDGERLPGAKALGHLRRFGHEDAMDEIRAALDAHAPTLRKAYGDLLFRRRKAIKWSSGLFNTKWPWYPLLILALAIIRYGVNRDPRPAYSSQPRPAVTEIDQSFFQSPPTPITENDFQRAARLADEVGRQAQLVSLPVVADEAKKTSEALTVGGCPEARVAYKKLSDRIMRHNLSKESGLARALDALRSTLVTACAFTPEQLP
jgi:hypothetical protein